YAALSYCWGGPQPYMATQAVAEKPIDFSGLGRTIQDAIVGTENLGLQYLWVDAICIAQHDDTEKAIEIGKMADIYQGSYITISAARAASYQEGFLSPYDTDQEVRITLKVKCPDGKVSSIILQEHREQPPKGNDFGPVMDRAWCLQEHVLAPRVLIYTSSALHFCCRTHIRSDSMNVVGGGSNFQPNALAALRKGGKTTMEAWQSIVAEFAKRSITVESDRLPAISAVAQ
ncbi:HET-domain-containing protein, partial [Tothia fuscella]